MDLDHLKSNWKNVGKEQKTPEELLAMTRIKNHPKVKRTRIKFLIETVLLVAFLMVYYDGFDGADKPFWANMLLICSGSIYILSRFVGWRILRNPIKDSNLKESLQNFHRNLKRISTAILFTSGLFGVAVISFFTTSIDFTKSKYLVLAFMVIVLFLLIYLSTRIWKSRIKSINYTLTELNNDDV